MRASLDQKFAAMSGFLLFCSIGACIAAVANAPAAAAHHSTQTEITDINRINKADRLTAPPIRQAQQKSSPPAATMKTSLQRPPLGCEPAFSPVAEPTRAAIYKRCTV
jgi:hypothetical protein